MSALIKKGITRKIILNKEFSFYTPEYTLEEIKKYENLIIKKSNLTKKEYETILNILFENIKTIPLKEYEENIEDATQEIIDEKDIPFLALAKHKKIGIWTDDKDFDKVKSVKIYKTKKLLTKTGVIFY